MTLEAKTKSRKITQFGLFGEDSKKRINQKASAPRCIKCGKFTEGTCEGCERPLCCPIWDEDTGFCLCQQCYNVLAELDEITDPFFEDPEIIEAIQAEAEAFIELQESNPILGKWEAESLGDALVRTAENLKTMLRGINNP